MSRQLEQKREQRQARRDSAAVYALEYGLAESIQELGAELLGFSLKYGGADCLMVIKTLAGDKRQVSFVGGIDPISCIVKAARLAGSDELVWRVDKF